MLMWLPLLKQSMWLPLFKRLSSSTERALNPMTRMLWTRTMRAMIRTTKKSNLKKFKELIVVAVYVLFVSVRPLANRS